MRKFIKKFKSIRFKNKFNKAKKIFTRRVFKQAALKVLRKKEILSKSRSTSIKNLKNILVELRPAPVRPKIKKPVNKLVMPNMTKVLAEHAMFYSLCRPNNLYAKRSDGAQETIKSYPQIYTTLHKNRSRNITSSQSLAEKLPVTSVYRSPKKVWSDMPKKGKKKFLKQLSGVSVDTSAKKVSPHRSKNWIPEDTWKKMTGAEKHAFLVKTGKIKI